MAAEGIHYGDWIIVAGYFVAVILVGILVGASLFASNIGSGHFIVLAGSGASSGIAVASFELTAIFILVVLGWFFVPVYVAAGVFTMPEYLRKRFGGQRIRVYLSVLSLMLYAFTKIAADLYSGAIFLTQAIPGLNVYVAIIILLAVSAVFTIGGGFTAVLWTDFIQTIIMIAGALVLMTIGFIEVGGYEQLRLRYLSSYPNTTLQHLGRDDNYSYTQCGIPPANAYNLMRPADDTNLPWPGIMFGLTISSMWYWCSDQVIVQRALAAKNISHAKGGCILAAYLKFLPLFLMIFPGMIARILYTDRVACADPISCQAVCSQNSCSNIAFPTLVLELMPVGVRGLMLSVMMSALVSSLTSIFNSSSTIFTIDIWRRVRKNATETELMVVGSEWKNHWLVNGQKGDYQQRTVEYTGQGKTQKISLVIHCIPITIPVVLIISCHWIIWNQDERVRLTLRNSPSIKSNLRTSHIVISTDDNMVFFGNNGQTTTTVGIGIVWMPVLQSVKDLVHYYQGITSCIAPPICAVYVLAIFWKRTNEKGAFWGLMIGLCVGLIRFAWEYSYQNYPCGEGYKDRKPDIISKVHYLHFGIILFGIAVAATVVISLLTPPIDDVHLERLTYWGRFSTRQRIDISEVEDEEKPKPDSKETLKPYQDDYDTLPWYKKACQWICGIEKMSQEHQMTDAEMRAIEEKQTSIYESRTAELFLNINAIFLMTLAAFVMGFYA